MLAEIRRTETLLAANESALVKRLKEEADLVGELTKAEKEKIVLQLEKTELGPKVLNQDELVRKKGIEKDSI